MNAYNAQEWDFEAEVLESQSSPPVHDQRVVNVDFVRGNVQSTAHPEQDFVQPEHPSVQSEHTLKYTAQQIADRYPALGKGGKPLGDAAIRTRWYDWIV